MKTFRISRAVLGGSFAAGDGDSRFPAMRPNGSEVAFSSLARNFSTQESDSFEDVFLLNFTTSTDLIDSTLFSLTLMSLAPVPPANGNSLAPMINNEFIVFQSNASNLVVGDTNGTTDIFLRSLTGGVTTVYRFNVRQTAAGQATGGPSTTPDVASSSRAVMPNEEIVVVYDSLATNLDPMDSNAVRDIFESRSRSFRRGDCNQDGILDLADVLCVSNALGTMQPACEDPADIDDTGTLNTTDVIRLRDFLFASGPPPALPFPNCGRDTTVDSQGLFCGGGFDMGACPGG